MPSLNYATTGPGRLYQTIGWFNFASLPANIVPGSTFTLTNDILGGGTITATFTLTSTSTLTRFNGQVPPLWTGAAFGNTAYRGLTQKVCLRGTGGGTGTIRVNAIDIRDKFNNPITNYNFYFTDSETPAAGETETFITNGSAWELFYQMPNSGQGFATLSGLGTTSVTATGLGNTPILLTKSPTEITQTVIGGGAMSFGISLTQVELYKVITQRLNASDQFQLSINGPTSGTTITTGASTGLQLQNVQATSGVDGVFIFNENMAPGSVNPLSFYTQTIQLSNKATGGTTLPNTVPLGTPVTLANGDYAVMTITNSPAPTTVTLTKSVDKPFCSLGDTLTYTLVVRNQSPYAVNDVVVTDTIPNNSTLIPTSVKVNGNSVSESPAPPLGVTVGTIFAGAVATVTFSVTVTSTLPSPNTVVNNATTNFSPKINIGSVNSQTVVTTINSALLTATKTTNRTFANIGDTINYTIVLRNIGNVSATNILFVDTIPNGTTFVANSLRQDNVAVSGSPNPPGVTLPNSIAVNGTSTVTFSVRVNEIPTPNPIPNNAEVGYTFTIDSTTTPVRTSQKSSSTNTVTTQVNVASLSGITKSVNKTIADCNDIITYTIAVPNTGNVDAVNVVIRDTIPNGTTFITNSVTVNGTGVSGANPATGISVGTIAAGSTATITFDVRVNC